MPRLQRSESKVDGDSKTALTINHRITISNLLLFLIICNLFTLNAHASWYAGGSMLLHPFPYYPLSTNYIEVGSSKLTVLGNGISINAGYKLCMPYFVLSTEGDVGAFSDSDGDVIYRNIRHFVSASYYVSLKEKLGFYLNPNFMLYGLIGVSQNSIGDRVYTTEKTFNTKQVSVIYGGGLEYYTKRDSKIALFLETFYFNPTDMTLYSGGAKPPKKYSLSTGGIVLQLGMRYYFD